MDIKQTTTVPKCINWNLYKDFIIECDEYFIVTAGWEETIRGFENDLINNKILLSMDEYLDGNEEKDEEFNWNDQPWVKETNLKKDEITNEFDENADWEKYPTAEKSNKREGDDYYTNKDLWLKDGEDYEKYFLIGVVGHNTTNGKIFPMKTIWAFGVYSKVITEIIYHITKKYYGSEFRESLHLFDVQNKIPYREIECRNFGIVKKILKIKD